MPAYSHKRKRGYTHSYNCIEELHVPDFGNYSYPGGADSRRPQLDYIQTNWSSFPSHRAIPRPVYRDYEVEGLNKWRRTDLMFGTDESFNGYPAHMANGVGSPYQGPMHDRLNSGHAETWNLDALHRGNFNHWNSYKPYPPSFLQHSNHSNVQNCPKYISQIAAQTPETDANHQWTPPKSNPSLGNYSPGYTSCHDKNADKQVLSQSNCSNLVSTVLIHGKPRELRYYGEQAVVLMSDDDPRLLSFAPGKRKVYINNFSVDCWAGADYVTFTSNGRLHKVKLGSPTREVYINGKWFSCPFNAPPANVYIGDEYILLALQGPALKHKIGSQKNVDYLAGKITLTIDQTNSVAVYLDEEVQPIDLGGKSVGLQFKNSLRSVLIDKTIYPVCFGEKPVEVEVDGKLHSLRFSSLPKGVRPGMVFKHRNPIVQTQLASQPPTDVSQLVAKLLEKGLLPAPQISAVELLQQDIKEINFSDRKGMRVKNTVLIDQLYDGKQCEICSLRFADDTIVAHMHWHAQEKETEGSVRCRQWYVDAKAWKYSVTAPLSI